MPIPRFPNLCGVADDGNYTATRLHILSGADVNKRDHVEGESPLHFAAWSKHVGIVRQLLDAGADANATCDFDWSPLGSAMDDDATEEAELLIRAGADFNKIMGYGQTYLYQAICANCEAIARLLLDAGAAPSKPNRDGQLPLPSARSAFMRWRLLAAGAQPDPGFPLPKLLYAPAPIWSTHEA